jgi:hypothetical protein
MDHLGSGPMWDSTNSHLIQLCKENWWSALLYIQNYVGGYRMVRKLWIKLHYDKVSAAKVLNNLSVKINLRNKKWKEYVHMREENYSSLMHCHS